ncbi:MAG: hypothetical protein EBS71_04030, partial [Actinobacteria bacterium]|nr:hypothetical protein [Actinomycetota bacterium]
MQIIRDDNWVLSVGTFLPMLGVLVLLVTPKAQEAAIKMIALITSIATVAVGAYTLLQFDFDKAGSMQFVAETNWISVIKSTYFIGVDGISLPLYLLSMVVTLLVVIYSLDHVPSPGNPKAFFILMLILQTGMAGTFIAQDLILFFVFFELVLLPMYFMIGVWGGEQRQYASLKFFLYTMFGSALMLVAFLAMFFKTGAESFAIPFLVENGVGIAKNVNVGGNMSFPDEKKLVFGTNPSSPDNKNHQLEIYASPSTNSYGSNIIGCASTDRVLRVQTNGAFVVEGTDGQNLIRATNPKWTQTISFANNPGGKGSVELYYIDDPIGGGDVNNDDGLRLYTTTSGATVTGTLLATTA